MATIRGCHECPLQYDATYCLHPESPNDLDVFIGMDQECAPEGCPLRVKPLTITLVDLRLPFRIP